MNEHTMGRGELYGAPILDDRGREHWESGVVVFERAGAVDPRNHNSPCNRAWGRSMHGTGVEHGRAVVIALQEGDDVPNSEAWRRVK